MAGIDGGPQEGAEGDDMRARLDALGSQLGARGGSPAASEGPQRRGGSGVVSGGAMAKGMRAASELIGGIVVGGFIGWQLDRWLGTRPWLSILFFLLGTVAGFWNVMRGAFAPTPPAQRGDAHGPNPNSGLDS